MATQTTEDSVNLILVGKTGAGKSSTANTIIGQIRFTANASQRVVTKVCKAEFAHVLGRKIKVVDLPGLANGELDETDDIRKVIENVMTAVAETPDGYDAILIVIRFGRQSKEDQKIVAQLKAILGHNYIAEFGILLITYGDLFDLESDNGQTIEEWCSSEEGILKDLLKECRDRVVLFHNKSKDSKLKERQLNHLLSIVDKMKSGHRYLPKHFGDAQRERQKLLAESQGQRAIHKIREPIRLMMNDLDGINVEERPEAAILKLHDLLGQAEELRHEVASQDNSTGALDSALNLIKSVEQAVHDRLRFAESVQKNRELHAKMKAENEEERQKLHRLLEEKDLEMQETEQKQKQKREEAEKKYEELVEKQNMTLRKTIIITLVTSAIAIGIPALVLASIGVFMIPGVGYVAGRAVSVIHPILESNFFQDVEKNIEKEIEKKQEEENKDEEKRDK